MSGTKKELLEDESDCNDAFCTDRKLKSWLKLQPGVVMTTITHALDSSPNTVPVPPTRNQVANRRGRIYTPLPKMRIGFVLAFICLAFQITDRTAALVVLTSMAGSCYWMFCIHRIHKVLADYTLGSYAVSPRKAVGFQLIPVFGYFWAFRWTRQIARFLDEESLGLCMPKVWPGSLLVAASVLGMFEPLKFLRLFLIFGFGLYLTRKLRSVLPPCRPYCLKRSQQWNLSTSAGVGAAFSFVLFQAIRHFGKENATEKLHDLAAIFIVSVGIMIFLEPVLEQLRIVLGIEEHHPALQSRKPLLRVSIFLILVVTSVFHGLLHSEVESAVKVDLYGTTATLLAALLGAGGITYFWIVGSHRHPSQAARSGVLSGAVLGCLVAFGLLVALSVRSSPADDAQPTMQQDVILFAIPWVPVRVLDAVATRGGANINPWQMVAIALPWAVFGFAGGIAIDKRWKKGTASGVALSISVAAVISGVALWLTGRVSSCTEMLSHLSAVVGWGLALVACSSSRILTPEEEADSQVEPVL